MNIIDRLKSAASVMTGSKPQASWNWRSGTKSGHLFDGSKFSGSNMYPSKWGMDTEALRNQSRAAYWDSTQAQAMLGRLADNVIGTGLALESRPIWKLIGDQGMDDNAKHEMAREIELRFDLWASSHEPDAAGKMTLYEIQGMEFLNRLRDGETFHILRYSGNASRMSPLSIQTILPEQVMTPLDKLAENSAKNYGARIVDGVEIDAYGGEQAIHVSEDPENYKSTTRIPAYGPSGRRFVVHPVNSDTLGAVRGTPLLANCIHELKKITDGTVAELEAMVINAVLAVWVKPGPDAPASRALSGIRTRGSESSAQTERTEPGRTTFDKPGLIIQSLKAGEAIESFDTKRPNVNFGTFIDHIVKHLSASKGIPASVSFLEATKSYSAIRAELIMFWNKVEIERMRTASQFLGVIFESWFNEEVRAGRIAAAGFDKSPVIKRAWLNSAWMGDGMPSIDPLKEAMSDAERINQGTTTRERVAMEYNGSDAMDNIKRLVVENAALAAARAPLDPVAVPVMEQKDNQSQPDDQYKNQDDEE